MNSKRILLPLMVLLLAQQVPAQIKHALRDTQGRHVIPRGFVVNTNDHVGPVEFDADDYARMVRMGANYQVVRLELGRLSSYPGYQFEESYLDKLERLVRLGRETGITTVFKMTVYTVKGFSWEDFWANENNEQDIYVEAWRHIWERFKDDPSVVAYDLVNEPRKLTMDISYVDLTNEHLIPLYERLIDEAQSIGPDKLYLCQTIFMNKGEAINHNQYAEITKPINRDGIVFSPHIYQDRIELIEPIMRRFEKEALMLDAPILIGEWGFPTYESADTSVKEQLEYIEMYVRTAEVFDAMGVGSIKAWFLGNRTMQDFLPGGRSTWAIFSDEVAAGTVERKYITDVIARPYPQTIAGDIHSFMFNHATRVLEMQITPDNSTGASRIFVAADRHYPDGFSVHCGDDMILCYNPLKAKGIEVIQAGARSNPSDFIWNPATQQLIVLRWPVDGEELTVKIVPGIATVD